MDASNTVHSLVCEGEELKKSLSEYVEIGVDAIGLGTNNMDCR